MATTKENVKWCCCFGWVKSVQSWGIKEWALFQQVMIITLSIIQIIFVCAVLGDGQSVITMKDDADLVPVVTLPIGGASTPLTLRQVIYHPYSPGHFSPYGIGADHDMWGRDWSTHGGTMSLKEALTALTVGGADPVPGVLGALQQRVQFHIASFLGCQGLIDAGTAAKAFCYIAVFAAFIQTFVSLLHLASPERKLLTLLTPIIQLVLFIGFLIVAILIRVIHTSEWACDNALIPKVKLDDHFDLNYANGFAIAGILDSVIMFTLSLFIFQVTWLKKSFKSTEELVQEITLEKNSVKDAEVLRVKEEAAQRREAETTKIEKNKEAQRASQLSKITKDKEKEIKMAVDKVTKEKDAEIAQAKGDKEKQRKSALAKIQMKYGDTEFTQEEVDEIKQEYDDRRAADLARINDEKDKEAKNLREEIARLQADRDANHKVEVTAINEEKEVKVKDLMAQLDGISSLSPEELNGGGGKPNSCGCRL